MVTPRVCQECTPPGEAPTWDTRLLCSLPGSDHTAEQLQKELEGLFPPCKSEAAKLLKEEHVRSSPQHLKNANQSHALAYTEAAQASLAIILLCFSLAQ